METIGLLEVTAYNKVYYSPLKMSTTESTTRGSNIYLVAGSQQKMGVSAVINCSDRIDCLTCFVLQ